MTKPKQRLAFWLGAIAIIAVSVLVVLSGSSTTPVPDVEGSTLTKNITADDWTKGNPDAKIQIVEYSDFQCPACQYYYVIIERVVREFENYVYFTYRNFPLRQIHKNSDAAAAAAEAAGEQGKFWEMYDLVFANQQTWAGQETADAKVTFATYAAQLELDVDAFNKAMDSSSVKSAIEDDLKSGEESGVNFTPSIFVNGVKFENNPSFEAFRSIIRTEIEKTTK